jgi:RHS repeat-associated protein
LQEARINGGSTSTTKYWNRFYETTGATTTMYVFAGSQLIATIEGNGTTTTTNITHTDHQNSTNVVSDGSGALKQLVNVYPYGSMRINQQPDSGFNTKRKFIGEYQDDAVSLSYLNARYYNNAVGRFMGEDPILTSVPDTELLLAPQSLNYYSYAGKRKTGISPID